MAFETVGSAYIDVHANPDPFAREIDPALQKGLKQASKDADEILSKIGKGFGSKIGASTEEELGKRGKTFGRAIEDATEKVDVHVKSKFTYDKNGRAHDSLGRFARSAVDDLESEIERAARRSGRGGNGNDRGGIFSSIFGGLGSTFSSAAGSISGIQGLALVTGPAILALFGLIVAAVQAANALAAVLTTIPALLFSIGIQAGVLFLAFRGVGTAISGAFAAKNTTELNAALKGLTPPAQQFVKSLLPLKPLFKEIATLVQSGFFLALGTSIPKTLEKLGALFKGSLSQTAGALGGFFNALANFFGSDVFIKFVSDVFPATINWINTFGPAFIHLLSALTSMADASLPFLTWIGEKFAGVLNDLASLIEGAVKDGSFGDWLTSMKDTLSSIWDLFKSVGAFVATLLSQLDNSSGKNVIDKLAESIDLITRLLASPNGLKAIEALVHLAEISFYIFTAVLLVLGALLAAAELFAEWFRKTGLPAIRSFAVGAKNILLDFLLWLVRILGGSTNQAMQNVLHTAAKTFANSGTLLFRAGKAMINGLIDGIRSSIPSLSGLLSYITNSLPDWKGPEDKDKKILEPAGRSVMEGFRDGLRMGSKDVAKLLDDYTGNLAGVSPRNSGPILFGPGAIRLTFQGALPTDEQATRAGRAVGAGITDQLAKRNTRLAVRTL